MRNRSTALCIASAFCAALALAAAVLAALGAGERGTHVALQATARLSFVLFWPAYAAAARARMEHLLLLARDAQHLADDRHR